MPLVSAAIDVHGIEAGSQTEKMLSEVVIEDFIRTQYRPLLYYIFFDQGSSEIAPRYRKITADATPAYHYAEFYDYETLPLYYEVLNIYGERLREHPKATIRVSFSVVP